jgi:ParB/RepB/Spo0J family partition protein
MSQAKTETEEAVQTSAHRPDRQQNHTVRMLALKTLVPSKTNPRKNFNPEALQELAGSIKSKGVLQPILVRTITGSMPGRPTFEIVAGERRYRAAALAGLGEIPCIVRELTDQEAQEIQIIENLQRQDLEPLEEAEGYRALMATGYTVEQLTDKLKKSRSYVYGMLKLAELPDVAKKALQDGLIPKSTAELIARLPNEKLRAKFAAEVLKPDWQGDPMSLRRAKDLLERSYTVELKGAPFDTKDAELVPEAGSCTSCPKMTGNSRELFPEGRADICTDPICFDGKKSANILRLKKKAETEGLEVLDAKTSAKLFSPYSSGVARGAGFVDLKEQCFDDPKRRSYKELLGDAVKPVAAFDRDGVLHKLAKVEDAVKVLTERHKLKETRSTSNHAAQPAGKPYDHSAEEKKRKEKAEVRELALKKAIAAVAAYKWAVTGPIFRFLIPALLETEPYQLHEIPLLEGNLKQDACHRLRAVVTKAKTEGEVVGIAMQIIVSEGLASWEEGYDQNRDGLEDAHKVLSMAKVNLDALLETAKKEIAATKAKEQPKVKAQKKSPSSKSFPKPAKKAKRKK